MSKTRAQRRIAERTAANQKRREAIPAQFSEYRRHDPLPIDKCLADGLITLEQQSAARRLQELAQGMGGHLSQLRAASLEYRPRSSSSEPTPHEIYCCQQYNAAIQAVGPFRWPVFAVVVVNESIADYASRFRRTVDEGLEVLRMGRDRRAEHFGFRPPRDDWHDAIVSWAAKQSGRVRTRDVLFQVFGRPFKRQLRSDQMRVAKILAELGWQKVHTRQGKVWVIEGDHAENGSSGGLRRSLLKEAGETWHLKGIGEELFAASGGGFVYHDCNEDGTLTLRTAKKAIR
jgi:hypothetical protein